MTATKCYKMEGKNEIVSVFPAICINIERWVISYFQSANHEIRETPLMFSVKSKAFRYLCCVGYWQDVKNKTVTRIEDLPLEEKKELWSVVIAEGKGQLTANECHMVALCFHWFGCLIQKHIETDA